MSLRSLPCYSQDHNSCWLDVSLQALYVAVSSDYHSFEERFRGVISSDTLIYKLYQSLNLRRTIQSEPDGQNNCPPFLNIQRDVLRRSLAQYPRPIVASMTSMENAFVSSLYG